MAVKLFKEQSKEIIELLNENIVERIQNKRVQNNLSAMSWFHKHSYHNSVFVMEVGV